MTRFLLFAFFLLLAMSPAAAVEQDPPFREDSGLEKTEKLLMAGQYTAALDAAGRVLERRPNNADAYTYRGLAYYRLGDLAAAAKNFRTAVQLNPTHLGANKYLADLFLEAGDVPRALEQLQVIRMACGRSDCAELDALEREIDAFKGGGKKPSAVAETQPAPEDKTSK